MAAAPPLTTSAYVLHNLGLAAGFGGSLFGKVALNPAARVISDRNERARVVNAAWSGYNVVNALSLATTALTWFAGRTLISGRSISRKARRLVLTKDFLTGATLATGAINLMGNAVLARKAFREGMPMESGSQASPEAPPEGKAATRLVNWLGVVNLGLMAGLIGVSTWLDNASARSLKWRKVAALLP